MIIVLGSQKGGVGKSTLAVSIAAYLMSLGNRVIIVDADDQKSVLTWYNNRPEDLPHIPVTGATGNIKAMLKEHEKSYDFVIADCAGRDSAEMRSDGRRCIHFSFAPISDGPGCCASYMLRFYSSKRF